MSGLPPTFCSAALRRTPQSWTRVEHSEIGFVERCGGHTSGVVISERFDTPHRNGARDALRGVTGSELKDAARVNHVPFLKDLETGRLQLLVGEPDRDGRNADTALARAVSLPLMPEALEDVEGRHRFVRAALRAQVGAAKTFAPYFTFASVSDPWLAASLLCLDSARELAPGVAISAWISVPLTALRDGTLRAAVSTYARHLQPGAEIVLTVGELNASSSRDDLVDYFEVLAACDAAGLQAITDRVGDLSVAAVASFAVGCILGTRVYRTAPPPDVLHSDRRRAIRVGYHVARAGIKLRTVDDARRRRGARSIPQCGTRNCAALQPGVENRHRELRLHNAHDVLNEIQRARALGAPAFFNTLQRSKRKAQRTIGEAMVLANSRRQAA